MSLMAGYANGLTKNSERVTSTGMPKMPSYTIGVAKMNEPHMLSASLPMKASRK